MLCIVVLYLWTFRSLRHLMLGLGCVAAGFICSAAVCLLAFGKLYLLTLVCGSSVMGVAVDYSFLYFAHHLGNGPGWQPRACLKRLLPALTVGLATTLLGYATLLVAPFPGLRQIAVFSLVGLAGSFLTVICVLPDLLERPAPPRPRLMAGLTRMLRTGARQARNPRTLAALGLAALLLAAAATRARVDDDVHGLIRPSRALQADEARIQALTGFTNSGSFFLVEGADEAQLLAREEALRERLAPLIADGRLEGVQALSAFVPSPARQQAHLDANRAQLPALVQALGAVGFKPGVGPALAAELAASAGGPLTVAQWFQTPLSIPYHMLWLGATPNGLGSVVLPMGAPDGARLAQAAAGLPGVAWVDKAQSVTQLLGHFRRIASWALGAAVLLVGLALAWLYGAARAFATLAPALGGLLLALAGIALTGTPVTLFSVLALILVLGFGVDYSVFLMAGGPDDPSSLMGVLLAGLATLASYGLLAFSHTPALQGFALTVTLGVLGSLLVSFVALGPGQARSAG
jgi:predicted exporter